VLEAATTYGGFFGGQMTAAGRTPPARVLIIGVGVAGLAAIAAARGIGAEVRAFDVRPATRDQVESLGASFLEVSLEDEESGEDAGGYANVMSAEFIAAEMALFAEQAAEVDIIITTALIPGRKAPVLVTEEMVQSMKQGSVVVDMAAERGGNCACTVPDEVVVVHGTTVIGHTDFTSLLPKHASQFFSTNVVNLLEEMGGAESFAVDTDNEVIAHSLVVLEGGPPPPPPEMAPPPPAAKPAPPPAEVEAEAEAATEESAGAGSAVLKVLGGLVAIGAILAIGMFAPADFIRHLTVFVLACFIGYQVIWNVTAALHTPLMSVTNAISGIIVVGGMLHAMSGDSWGSTALGVVAVFVASINVFGGFLVTQRMLRMFRREGGAK
jgi:NAD(P) transhydrogenase subunit alpha